MPPAIVGLLGVLLLLGGCMSPSHASQPDWSSAKPVPLQMTFIGEALGRYGAAANQAGAPGVGHCHKASHFENATEEAPAKVFVARSVALPASGKLLVRVIRDSATGHVDLNVTDIPETGRIPVRAAFNSSLILVNIANGDVVSEPDDFGRQAGWRTDFTSSASKSWRYMAPGLGEDAFIEESLIINFFQPIDVYVASHAGSMC